MFSSVLRVFLLARDLPRGNERRDLNTEADQRQSVLIKVVGIRKAVALNVWAVRIIRIWPPVIAFGKIIVLATATARTRGRRDCHRVFVQVSVRGVEDAATIDGRDVGNR